MILLTGPAGSGKTTVARRIAEHDRWVHVSEDDLWGQIGHPSHKSRDDQGQELVHAKVHQLIDAAVQRGDNVVFEFLVYEDPPVRLTEYQRFLAGRRIDFVTRVLRPTLDTILERQRVRGRASDRNREVRRSQAEHQLRCLHSKQIDPGWLVDTSKETLDQTYVLHFRQLVAAARLPGEARRPTPMSPPPVKS